MYSTELPDFVIGFDLVGQEDLGKPLINFVDDLKQISRQAKFFFHAGETSKIILKFTYHNIHKEMF